MQHKIFAKKICSGEIFCPSFPPFIKELVEKLDPSWQDTLILIDNAKIHKGPEIVAIIHADDLLILLPENKGRVPKGWAMIYIKTF